jgi:hypothetical protein
MRIHQPLTLVLACAIFSSGLLFAQDSSRESAQNEAQSQQDTAVPQSPRAPAVIPASMPMEGKQDNRILGVLPNYRTADGTKDFVPMKPSGKMHIALKDSFDYPGFVVAAALASIYQLQDQNPSFGQGVKGYAHRYVTAVGDQLIGNMLAEGVMPVLLKEDPRYFRKVNGKFLPRLGYSLTRVLVARDDHGRPCVNFAELAGNGIAASIGNAYYPDNRGFGDTMQRMGTAVATDALSNVLKEFWPDIKNRLHHKDSGSLSVAP